jgi:hypothetical protein
MKLHQRRYPALPGTLNALLIVLAWGISLCFFLPDRGNSAENVITCDAEPTAQFIAYGLVVQCSIEEIGDADAFRFKGARGETIVVQTVKRGDWRGGGESSLV